MLSPQLATICAKEAGSIAVIEDFSAIGAAFGFERSRTRPIVNEIGVTLATPGTRATAGAIPGGMP